MKKKKKYQPREDDNWDIEADREHRRIIEKKSKAISETYRKWWDKEKHTWKKGYKRNE